MAVTGILMFFHLDSGLNKVVHEWASWAMVAAHLAVNYRAFIGYFKRPMAIGVVGVFALVLGLSFIPAGGGGPDETVGKVMQALNGAPVEQVIALAGHDTDEGLARLAQGGAQARAGQTLGELSGGDRGQEMKILWLILD
ncbi:MAG: hypothetical protein ACI8R4_002163 [Paracoccaceae bacterium]|jgi:hypothetical protein